ncbi:MAG: transporter [Methylococcaceae bacterium]
MTHTTYLPKTSFFLCSLIFLSQIYSFPLMAAEESLLPDDLPPQEAAQAAATALPSWRPFDALFQLFGTSAPESLQIKRSQADIHYPGPDLTNFPNSAFTLPKGGIYVEANPGSFTGGSDISNSSWGMPYLLRYGLTNDMELRVLSSGLTVDSDTVGFSPVGFDTKIHLGVVEYGWFNATLGLEATIQTGKWLASKAYESDDQYSLNLLIDHELPGDLSFEWNIGVTRHSSNENDLFLPTVQWAFQRDIFDDVAVYINGYHGHIPTPDITSAGYGTASWPQQQLIGFGAQWIMNERLAFFTGCNWGFTRFSPDYSTNLGFAISL